MTIRLSLSLVHDGMLSLTVSLICEELNQMFHGILTALFTKVFQLMRYVQSRMAGGENHTKRRHDANKIKEQTYFRGVRWSREASGLMLSVMEIYTTICHCGKNVNALPPPARTILPISVNQDSGMMCVLIVDQNMMSQLEFILIFLSAMIMQLSPYGILHDFLVTQIRLSIPNILFQIAEICLRPT